MASSLGMRFPAVRLGFGQWCVGSNGNRQPQPSIKRTRVSSRALLLGEERALASPWSQGEHERQVQRATWLAGEKAPGGSSHGVLGWLVQQHTRGKSPGYGLTAGIDTMCAMTIVQAGYHEGTCPLVWPETVGRASRQRACLQWGQRDTRGGY